MAKHSYCHKSNCDILQLAYLGKKLKEYSYTSALIFLNVCSVVWLASSKVQVTKWAPPRQGSYLSIFRFVLILEGCQTNILVYQVPSRLTKKNDGKKW